MGKPMKRTDAALIAPPGAPPVQAIWHLTGEPREYAFRPPVGADGCRWAGGLAEWRTGAAPAGHYAVVLFCLGNLS